MQCILHFHRETQGEEEEEEYDEGKAEWEDVQEEDVEKSQFSTNNKIIE